MLIVQKRIINRILCWCQWNTREENQEVIPVVGHTKGIADNLCMVFFFFFQGIRRRGTLSEVGGVISLRNHFSFFPLLQTTTFFTIFSICGQFSFHLGKREDFVGENIS